MSGTTLRSEPRFRSRGRHRSAWSPKRLNNLRAWYDAELGQPKYGGVGAYVQLDGTSGDYIYTPDAPNVDITGDLEVVMRVYCNDWSNGANQTIASKYVTTGNQRSWRVFTNNTGILSIVASGDGTAGTLATAAITPLVALPDATWIWLRARLQLSNGANSVGTLDTAADTGSNSVLPVSWTANGSATGTTLTSIFNSTSPVEIGSFATGTLERFSGRIGRCIVRDGFNGRTLTDFNASDCYGPGYLNQGTLPVDSSNARYVPLRGVSGDYVWTADKAALRITGDLEIVARIGPDTWSESGDKAICGKWLSAGNQRGFALHLSTAGVLKLYWSVAGSATVGGTSTAPVGFTAGQVGWVKVTLDVDNGAGGHDVRFFTAPDQVAEPTSWNQLGSTLASPAGAGITSIYANSEPLLVGQAQTNTGPNLAGRFYRVIVRNGIGGTTVADFNAEQATVFGQAADGYGNGWFIADPKHYGNWTVGLPKIYDRSGNNLAPAILGAGTNQPTWLSWRNSAQIYIPGQAGNFVSCPTSAALDIIGDVDLRATAWLASLTAAQNQTLVGTMRNGDLTGFILHVSATGSLQTFHGNGAAVLTTTCPVTLASAGVVPGKIYEFRAAIDVNDGAGNYVVSFYLRQPGEAWILLGTTTVSGATSIAVSGRACYIGQQDNFSARILTGSVIAASVHNGIGGTVVADFDASLCGQSGYTDAYSNVWVITRATSGRKAVVQSPTARSARSIILHGTDDYIDAPAAAIPALDTFAAASSVTPVIRRWHNPGTVGHAIFATKATSNAVALGTSIRNALTAADPLLVTQVGDGTANDGVNGTGALGTREVASVSVGSVSPIVSISVSGGAAVTDTNRTTTSTTTTAGAGRIGAYLGGTGAIDMEFEALICRNVGTTAQEHAKSVKYYRGGV